MRLTKLFRQYRAPVASEVRNVAASDDGVFSIAELLPDLARATAAQPGWNGVERRSGEDRRQQHRRQDDVPAMLNTRAGRDRRQLGRRADDRPALSGFVLKA